jgi:hypothetical protein
MPATTAMDPIGAEPVIIEASDSHGATKGDNHHQIAMDRDASTAAKGPSETIKNHKRPTFQEEVEIINPDHQLAKRQRRHQPIILTNASDLNSILFEPDLVVDTFGVGPIYVVNHAFSADDLNQLSWIFTIEPSIDPWVVKPPPISHQIRAGHQRFLADYYGLPHDHRHRYEDRRGGLTAPIVRLGCSLRVLDDDSEEYGTEKVKFVTCVQRDSSSGLVKQIVSYSRQAVAVDIFHEILNANSILFVGAVLKDVPIPVEITGRGSGITFQRVGSVKAAEEVGEGVIGVIC